MFKPELWQCHDEYRTIVNTYGRRLSRSHPKYSWTDYEPERQKLLNLNLDPLVGYISGFYSNGGRAVTAQPLFPMPPLTAGIFPPAAKPAHTGKTADDTILTRMPHGDGTVTTKHGTSGIPFTCCAPETIR